MSGNSPRRRSQTAPIVWRGACVVVGSVVALMGQPRLAHERRGVWGPGRVPTLSRRRGPVGETRCPPRTRAEGERWSWQEEGHPVLPDLYFVIGAKHGILDPVPVDERAVQAAEVADHVDVALVDDLGVPSRDRDVVEEHVAVRRTADQRPRLEELERLARATAARAHDERRPADLGRGRPGVTQLVGAEAHRRLPLLVATEVRAAAGAVVRRLGVLEATLRAVDVAH